MPSRRKSGMQFMRFLRCETPTMELVDLLLVEWWWWLRIESTREITIRRSAMVQRAFPCIFPPIGGPRKPPLNFRQKKQDVTVRELSELIGIQESEQRNCHQQPPSLSVCLSVCERWMETVRGVDASVNKGPACSCVVLMLSGLLLLLPLPLLCCCHRLPYLPEISVAIGRCCSAGD
ncbi:hypothetical protein K440DRAFT_384228 [Wilcoxina mikolae CBS 423.85]|nr:hypothetical protein K440DRAFT_384228 [Wilcoxina mikolae CBS 423.85]